VVDHVGKSDCLFGPFPLVVDRIYLEIEVVSGLPTLGDGHKEFEVVEAMKESARRVFGIPERLNPSHITALIGRLLGRKYLVKVFVEEELGTEIVFRHSERETLGRDVVEAIMLTVDFPDLGAEAEGHPVDKVGRKSQAEQ
jgi:hypothetical protein